MAAPHLSFGTSTNRINLLNPKGGFCLDGWDVGNTELDTIFQESQLADFRQMAAYRDITTIETFRLNLFGSSQDSVARDLQAMRAMIRLCADYWATTWQTSVVYLQARASCETNTRYAVAYDARLVGESNPFGQPFLQPASGTVMNALSLIVERGPWLADQPGSTGTCVPISSQGADFTKRSLYFGEAITDRVACGSDASIDNLPSADFTIETWVKTEDPCTGEIANKTGWRLSISSKDGIRAWADHVTDAETTTDDVYALETWAHVAAAWDQSALQWDIAVNGIWVDTTITPGAGAYAGDAADVLYLGNRDAAGFFTTALEGYLAWTRISDGHRYTVGNDFTPPDRCLCPPSGDVEGDFLLLETGDYLLLENDNAVDADTIAIWCLTEGAGATAYDGTENDNDGTITGADWQLADCYTEFMEETCDAQSVFVANKANVAQISHIYYWDNSATQWTDGAAPPNNLQGDATPFAFLPAAPTQDDFVIFGIDTSLADSGPFCSLVFDIGTAIGIGAGGLTIEWRYYDAGGGVTADPSTWPTLTVQDNTDASGDMDGDAFDTTGIGSVHWAQPSDWTEVDPDPTGADNIGVTGYWVCAYISNVGIGAKTPPTQQNRDIYTVTWPYVDITADEVSGDMPALLRMGVDSRSATDALSTTTDLYAQRVIAGLRSCDRGEDFNAFINLADEQLPPGSSLDLGNDTTYQDMVTAPAGRAVRYTIGAADTDEYRILVSLDDNWYGRFHAFLRVYQTAGYANTVEVHLQYNTADAYYGLTSTVTRTIPSTDDDLLLDFGEIALGPAVDISPYNMENTHVDVWAVATDAGGATVYFYDLILIPVDEWAIDAEDMYKNVGAPIYTNDYRSYLNLDILQNPRRLLSYLIYTIKDTVYRYWRPIVNGLPILQANKHQRLWFLHARNDDYADVDDIRSDCEICSSLQVWKNQRYTTLRGDQ